MDELCFRADDPKGRPRWVAIAVALGIPVVRLVLDYLRHHELWELFAIPGVPLFALLLVLSLRRGRTQVGWEGIRIIWFGGSGRLIPWSEVQEIRVRTSPGNRNVQVVLANGKRRTLPGLGESTVFPDPALESKAQQVNALFERYAGVSQPVEETFAPPPRASRPAGRVIRLPGSGVWQGALAALLLVPLIAGSMRVADGLSRAATHQSTATVGYAQPVQGGDYVLELTDGPSSDVGAASIIVYLPRSDSWLAGLGSGDPIAVEATSNGTITAVGPGDAGDWQGTTEGPAAVTAVALADLAPVLLLFVVLVCWSVGLVRARRRHRTPGFRWWVPLSLPALVVLAVIAAREEQSTLPLTPQEYLPPVALLVGGLGIAALVGAARHRRRTLLPPGEEPLPLDV